MNRTPKRTITVTVTMTIATLSSLLATLVTLVGCQDKKADVQLAPTASALAKSSPTSAKTVKFVIEPTSKTSMELEAPLEKIKARTEGASGSLDIDLTNITASRGEVKIDLTTLTTSTFSDEKKNASQTGHARTWLEVADGEEGKVEDKTKADNRWAVYAIRGVENASAGDVTKVAPTKDGADDVRKVTLTTKGELLVHGRKVDRDAEIALEFRYDTGAPVDKPKVLVIKSTKPFRVVLAEHDVKPRDAAGKIAKDKFSLLGTKVAENADISLDLRAKP